MKLLGLGNSNSGSSNVDRGAARSKYLVQAIALEENRSVYQLRNIIMLISFLVFGLIAWCYFAEMPEIASAEGEVIPYGRVHKIQHLDGGVISDIYVRDGDTVKEGETLLTLDDTLLVAELSSMRSSRIDLTLRLERLNALLLNRKLNFDQYDEGYDRLVKSHLGLYNEQISGNKERISSFDQKITNRQIELISKKNQQRALQEELVIYQQNGDMRNNLFDQGLMSKAEVLEWSARMASTRNRLAEVEGELSRLDNQINELSQELKEYQVLRREQFTQEKSETVRSLTITENQIEEIESRLHRLNVKSQISGIVKGLQIHSINEVIRPGEILMEIVPVGDELLVEAKIKPKDIGHVVLGLPVDVKVSSFEYQKFGSIPGSVFKVSASTLIDTMNNNAPYYSVEVKLSKNHVGNFSDTNLIVPGMVVQADIITGSKTILEYILKPIRRGFDGSFSER